MANLIYPKFKEALLDASPNSDLNDGDVRVILVDMADYTYASTHQFLTDLPAPARVAVSGALANTTVANGLFDADDVTWASVTGDVSEAIVIYVHTGSDSTSRLVALLDTGVTGLPVIPNGGNIQVSWNPSGIFQL